MRIRRRIEQLTGSVAGKVLSRLRPFNAVMLHLGRCGSTVLGDLLNQNRRIHWDGEVYSRVAVRKKLESSQGSDPWVLLQSRMLLAGHRIYGFELKFRPEQHLGRLGTDLSAAIRRLEELAFSRFIVLTRRNMLRVFVSSTVARSRGRFHERGAGTHHVEPVELALNNFRTSYPQLQLLEWLRERQQSYRELVGLVQDKKVLYLHYEDDVQNDPMRAYVRVCKFFQIPQDPVTVRYQKTTPQPLAEILSNYDQVCRHLSGTEFEWMLDA